jgi:hypothetical protein
VKHSMLLVARMAGFNPSNGVSPNSRGYCKILFNNESTCMAIGPTWGTSWLLRGVGCKGGKSTVHGHWTDSEQVVDEPHLEVETVYNSIPQVICRKGRDKHSRRHRHLRVCICAVRASVRCVRVCGRVEMDAVVVCV